MRYPESHKDEVRSRIVEAAARALRRAGLAGVSIPGLMKQAGLTHGAFYAHFPSRDELVAAAVLTAAESTGATVLSEEAGDLAATLEKYLSLDHVRHPEAGCVLAALGSEGRHATPLVRGAFAKAAIGFLRLLDRKKKPSPGGRFADETLVLASQMIGAVVLARLVDDDALATRLLRAVKQRA